MSATTFRQVWSANPGDGGCDAEDARCPVARTCTEITPGSNAPAAATDPSPLAAFRSVPAYVLLGEPGSGKTTEFRRECEDLGSSATYVTARDFVALDLDSHPEWRDKTLFIDGLDEMRAGATDARSPLDAIRSRLERLGRPKFRISCREADWLGSNDRQSLEAVSPDFQITVLRLDPLDDQAIREMITRQVDEARAEAFEDEARSRGLGSMLDNPQALELLVDAVRHGDTWPSTRRETFELACKHMASEHNTEYQAAGARTDADAILDAAGHLYALLLLGGFEGYRLVPGTSTTVPPTGFVPLRDAVSSYRPVAGSAQVGASGAVLRTISSSQTLALDKDALSRLFVAVNEGKFTPRHRQVAEFLAGRWLAGLIEQGLPASRILALMTSLGDGWVVTPLRGLSAWLAAHSAKARWLMIEADPVGVGLYGDIAGFSTEDKQRLLTSLVSFAAEGPLFGHQHYDDRTEGFGDGTARAFRSLASRDMVETIERLLNGPADQARHDRTSAFVLAVLAVAEDSEKESLKGLMPILRAIMNDPARPARTKEHALEAIIHIALPGQEGAQELIMLLDAIDDGTLLDPYDQLRGTLLKHLYPQYLTPARVWRHLTPRNNPRFIGAYLMFWKHDISERSSEQQVTELLDALCQDAERLVPAITNLRFNDMPVALLARALQAFDDTIDSERLFRWLSVVGKTHGWGHRRGKDAQFVMEWIEDRPDLQKRLFLGWLREAVGSNPEDRLHYRSCDALCYSQPPTDFGWWCLAQAVDLADSEPRVAGQLLEEAFRNREHPTTGKGLTLDVMRRRVGTGPLARRLDDLCDRSNQVSAEDHELQQMEALRVEHFEEQRQQQEQWASFLHSELDNLRGNQLHAPRLDTLAQAYLGKFVDLTQEASPRQRLGEFVGDHEELVEPVMAAIREAVFRDDVPTVDETLSLDSESKRSWMAYPVLASLHLLDEENPSRLDQIDDNRRREALAIRFCVAADTTPGRWHLRWFRQNPELVLDVLCRCAIHAIRRGDQAIVCLDTLNSLTSHDDLVHDARLRLIDAIPLRAPNKQMDLLDDSLARAMRHPHRDPILQIAAAKRLSLKSLVVAQRVRWLAVDALLAPSPDLSALKAYVGVNDKRVRHLAEFLRRTSRDDDMSRSLLTDMRDPTALRDMIEILGPSFPPAHWESGYVSPGMDMSELIGRLINLLGTVPGDDVDLALAEMADDPRLARWRDWLTGAHERQRVVDRDACYRHPSIEEVQRTLSRGAPANAGDLAALLVDRFEEISRNLRGDNSNPWRQFWTNDRENPPTQPKHEETCRDALLGILKERLPAEVEAAPEGRYAADTRADIRFICAGFNVPVEIKKNSHPDLWSALRRQLMSKYTTDRSTSGYGVYVVLWFGPYETKTPPDGKRPGTPDELRQRLEQDLAPDESHKISVVVLDVTKPGTESSNPRTAAAT